MLQEFIKSCLLVFVAEMGDKSQILALTFATKYPIRKVLLGVCIGAVLNHGIAVALGSYLSTVISVQWLRLVAALVFLGFGIWTLAGEEEDEEKTQGISHSFGPVLAIASAYFLSELGDKTQITAIGLAASAKTPLFVLMGTVSGMVLTGGVGIVIGSRLGHRVPELGIKLASSGIFTVFGLMSLYETLPSYWLSSGAVVIFLGLFGVLYYLLIKRAIRLNHGQKLGRLAAASAKLYEHLQRTRKAVDDICLGQKRCGSCLEEACPVGFAKKVLDASLDHNDRILESVPKFPTDVDKEFDIDKVAEALAETLVSCAECGAEHKELCAVYQTRSALELIYFGERLPFDGNIEAYLEYLTKKDKELSEKVGLQLSA